VDAAAIVRGKIEPQARSQQRIKATADPQRQPGEWNDLELICFGQTAIHVLNGQAVCVTTNARAVIETGEEQPVVDGWIAFVGYHGTIYVRDMELRPITALPPEVLEIAAPQ
jgi:hypothetical protein